MNFDLRVPIGILFTLFGTILVVLGLTTSQELYQASLGINVNLDWGLALLVFGLVMLGFVFRSNRKAHR
ncbi:hypothetical protein GETHLI_01970 [Geothrix limicola]|uniref:Uncharacterized protein n=1 Tax=Geothrix limicola TaxID=2927978 RepID=A0ABQ5QA44_9BACT|nr:hypothetical protein [Geothrix limicola]GLH71695.1 hypothetical protein GETHLI_01970 [Geothrix limicola]